MTCMCWCDNLNPPGPHLMDCRDARLFTKVVFSPTLIIVPFLWDTCGMLLKESCKDFSLVIYQAPTMILIQLIFSTCFCEIHLK